MSKIANNPTVSEEKVDIRRKAIGHRAMWMALMFDEMRKAGVEDAEGITRRAIARTGQIHGAGFKEKRGGAECICSFADAFLDPLGMKTFEMAPASSDDALEIDFHYCPLVTAWQALGFDDETIALLCDMAMDGDRNIAVANGLKFTLSDTIAAGCPTCKLKFEK
ncbi:MAG TPA: L-2-amino-thiazoline-4-carboxylic acid hydrolase [Terriglobales bacterium]|nr:L-2-amino-thiazoline-4-carboxylic acid hydrolase [Terriglobales bacterium]